MIAWIATLFAGRVSPKAAKALAWLTVIVVALLIAWTALESIKRGAVADERAKVAAKQAEATIAAQERAGKALDASTRARTAQKEELDDAAQKGDNSRAGPGVTAVIERVRRQQAARTD